MKKMLLTIAICFVFVFAGFSQDTFSIVAVDSSTGEVGSAGASCLGAGIGAPNGCILISDVHPGVGAIHTQAYYLPDNQVYGRSLMDRGFPPQEIIDSLVAYDAQGNPLIRQYGVVDFTGTAAYTGSGCDDYKNHITGPNYSIQGNILLGQQILDSMQFRFLNTPGNLTCKLMSALQGAKVPGADTRCLTKGISSLSAFVRVAQPGDTLGTLSFDLNVKSVPNDWHIDPIDSLQKLFDAANGCSNVASPLIESTTTQVHVFPDPATIFFTITSTDRIHEIVISEISSGRILQHENGDSQFSQKVFCKNLSQGVQLIKVVLEDGRTIFKKIVIQ